MNVVDLIVVALALLAMIRGWRRGILGQLFEFGGGFLGLLAGFALGPRIAESFSDDAGMTTALISMLVVFVFLSIGQTLGYLIGHRFGGFAKQARLGGVDSGLGAAFGVVITILTFWLVGTTVVRAAPRPVARTVRNSTILQLASKTFPDPPDVLAYFGHYLDTSGFPQVFAGLPRLTEPVDLPSNAEARKAIAAGKGSTVRVVLDACGGVQQGSGWISGPKTVVTNAHVVAGGDSVTVQELNGGNHSGEVVHFDPRKDLAVVRVETDLTGPPLKLEAAGLERGTAGATLGYPGKEEGRFTAHGAAVQGRYEARGRDIYGQDIVVREIYELRSPVRQGDSGGPFVLPSGEVAGVVFAASTTDDETGYALTGTEVVNDLTQARSATAPAPTGNCTH